MNWKITLLLGLSLAITAVCGCTSLTQVRFQVDESSLDYVQFRSTIVSGNSSEPSVVKLELAGSGYLEYLSGRSARVKDSFWQESDEPDWQDLRRDHVILSQAETVAVYQRLVDAGIFDSVSKREADSTTATELAILASIRFHKKLILTNDPVYLAIFEELLSRFE